MTVAGIDFVPPIILACQTLNCHLGRRMGMRFHCVRIVVWEKSCLWHSMAHFGVHPRDQPRTMQPGLLTRWVPRNHRYQLLRNNQWPCEIPSLLKTYHETVKPPSYYLRTHYRSDCCPRYHPKPANYPHCQMSDYQGQTPGRFCRHYYV